MKNEIRYQKIAALLANSLQRRTPRAGDAVYPKSETEQSGDERRDETAEATAAIGGER
ncbi:hypothetical protein [Rubripirellula amarantea]|uniref:hypothetical protein n=1 Tax=Rubripirellula amarantea TaxID=2527999 RepID=UPI0013EEEA73|nr:hypothetical protein [Rubripirellula amarantea]